MLYIALVMVRTAAAVFGCLWGCVYVCVCVCYEWQSPQGGSLTLSQGCWEIPVSSSLSHLYLFIFSLYRHLEMSRIIFQRDLSAIYFSMMALHFTVLIVFFISLFTSVVSSVAVVFDGGIMVRISLVCFLLWLRDTWEMAFLCNCVVLVFLFCPLLP